MNTPKEILKKYWGYDAFLPQQEQIVTNILAGNDMMIFFATGGGKSLCYQLPILLTDGLCLVISPLIALMKDQVNQLKNKEIPAAYISNEQSISETITILDRCKKDAVKLLYISPERLDTFNFKDHLKYINVKYIAIDEAHCIAEWGHDFRPAYLTISNIRKLFLNIPIMALTGSATSLIMNEIKEKLILKNPLVFKTSFERKNLAYQVFESSNKKRDLLYYLNKNKGSAIVFVNRRKITYEISQFLKSEGFDADYFHGKLDNDTKTRVQNHWMASDNSIIVATNAFGMGIDKPNVKLVVHLNLPTSLESYFQEVGRVGRAGQPGYGVLLHERNDNIQNEQLFLAEIANKIEFLAIVNKIYVAYQIADNEKPSPTFEFNLFEFTRKFAFEKSKTKNVLSFLQNNQLIHLSYLGNKSFVYIVNKKSINDNKLIQYLCRNYAGVLSDFVPIDEYQVAKELNTSIVVVKQRLKELAKQQIINYKSNDTRQITFLIPRNDNELRLIWWRLYERNSTIKYQKIKDIAYYIETNTICRNKLLMGYFGEKKANNCGKCDVCEKDKTGIINSKKNILNAILDYMSVESISTENILTHFSQYPKEKILESINFLLNEEKIKSKKINYYYK